MKRITTFLLVALIAGLLFSPAQAERIVRPADVVSMTTATSAVLDTSATIDCGNWEYIGISYVIDVVSGGSAGAGLYYVEGAVDSAGTILKWEKLWLIEYGDSLNLTQDVAWTTLQADDLLNAVIVNPVELDAVGLDNDDALDNQITYDCTWLPYTKLRIISKDTNWNASANVYIQWILKPE